MTSDSESELRIRLVARKLPFNQYKLLAEWLNCYQYIIPDQRVLNYHFAQVRPKNINKFSASDIFIHAQWCDQIQTTLTKDEQDKLFWDKYCEIL